MRTGLILSKDLNGSKKRMVSTRVIAAEIMKLMKNHIGLQDSISKSQLFKRLFNVAYDDKRLDHWMLWEFSKRAMHLLRRDSNCFVASILDEINHEYYYFVVKDGIDADIYINTLENSIKRMRSMQRRVIKAVDEKWYKNAGAWSIDYNKTLKLDGGAENV